MEVISEVILMQKLSVTALAIPLILASIFSLATIPIARAETLVNSLDNTRVNTLTVTGKGNRSIPTTKARVLIEVEAEAKTAKDAQSELALRSNAVIAELKNLKVDKLQTTNFALNPKIVTENDKQIQVGFIGQISLSFVTNIDRSGIVLDRAIAAGANRVTQITFSAEEEAILAVRSLALEDAVKDAQLQVKAVLNSLNLKPKSIRTIRINGDIPQGFLTNRQNLNVDSSGTPVIGGEQAVQASVTLEIIY